MATVGTPPALLRLFAAAAVLLWGVTEHCEPQRACPWSLWYQGALAGHAADVCDLVGGPGREAMDDAMLWKGCMLRAAIWE